MTENIEKRRRGRPRKYIEQGQYNVVLRVFDEVAEEKVVRAMIDKAVKYKDVPAATWLWDRKYGKVVDRIQTDNDVIIRVVYEDADTQLA